VRSQRRWDRPELLVPIAPWLGLLALLGVLACSPERGSEAWCEDLRKTHKADWSTNDAVAFAKHCVFK